MMTLELIENGIEQHERESNGISFFLLLDSMAFDCIFLLNSAILIVNAVSRVRHRNCRIDSNLCRRLERAP